MHMKQAKIKKLCELLDSFFLFNYNDYTFMYKLKFEI